MAAGAKAVATGSWSVAAANGFDDGEEVPLDVALANLSRIVAAVEVPVSLDFEGAYATAPGDVGENAASAIAAGAIGLNFEDQIVGGEGLHTVTEQQARIRAMRAAGRRGGHSRLHQRAHRSVPQAKTGEHGAIHRRAIERGQAYAEAGA